MLALLEIDFEFKNPDLLRKLEKSLTRCKPDGTVEHLIERTHSRAGPCSPPSVTKPDGRQHASQTTSERPLRPRSSLAKREARALAGCGRRGKSAKDPTAWHRVQMRLREEILSAM